MPEKMPKNKDPELSRLRTWWRPATGWVCVCGLAYAFIVQPIMPWLIGMIGIDQPVKLPRLDTAALVSLVPICLGMGGIRTVEKLRQRLARK